MSSDAIPEPHFHKCMEEVAKRNGFKEPRFEVSSGCDVGDSFFSVVYRVVVSELNADSGENNNYKKKKLSLMCKGTLQLTARREIFNLNRSFRNEANFYRLLDAYGDLMQEKALLPPGDSSYPEAPRCYLASVEGASEADMIITKDMSAEGYAMLCKRQGLGVAHARAMLGALARLHAASFALESLRPKQFQRLRANVTEVFQEQGAILELFSSQIVSMTALGAIKSGRRFPEGSVEYRKVQAYCARTDDELLRLVAPCTEGGNVISHGDCRINNILFKEDSEGSLPRVCFIDFQMARYGSPVLDLVYFLYTSTEKEMRDAHLDALLREYHAELRARMLALGVPDPDALFSWDRLQAHLRSYACYGFIVAASLLPPFLAEEDVLPDLDTELQNKDPSALKVAQLVKIKDMRVHEKRLCDVAEEMIDRGYF